MRYGDLKSEIKTESPRFQVMGDSMGMNSLWLFLGMVVITFAVWLYGKSSSPGLSGNVVKGYRVIAGIFLILGIWCGFPWEEKPVDGEIEWGEWSPELEASLKNKVRLFMLITRQNGVLRVWLTRGFIPMIQSLHFSKIKKWLPCVQIGPTEDR